MHKAPEFNDIKLFSEELKELLKKYNYAGCVGAIISGNGGVAFEQLNGPMLLETDNARIAVTYAMLVKHMQRFQ